MRDDMIELGAISYFQAESDDTLIQYMRAVGLAHLLAGSLYSCAAISESS